MADEKLYESASVWDQKLQLGQRNLIQAICDHWPKNMRTALDVGCGDGKITHTLAERLNTSFHGFDGSREALSRLRLPSTHGDVSTLPFVNDAFDVVLTTDVFEHLPDQVEQAAWQELFRVARDWVFIAVPFREELQDASTICANCGEQYHVNWHHRCYDFDGLKKRMPPGWKLVRGVLTGERWSPMLLPETEYRRQALNEWSGWTEAVCPSCGAPGQLPVNPVTLPADVARSLGQYTYDIISKRRFARNHSEILIIFCRAELAIENDTLPKCDAEEISAAQWVSRQGVSDNLEPYPQVARVVPSVSGGYIAQFPVYTTSQPALSFFASGRKTVSVVVEDGIGQLYSGDCDLSSDNPTRIHLPREACTSNYGLIVRISSIACIESIVLEGCNPKVSWLYPSGTNDCYFDVPSTLLRVHAADCVWVDSDSLLTLNFGTGLAVVSAVQSLLRADFLFQQLSQEHQQLKQEHQQLKQEHQQLKQEHQQLKQEHQQLKQEHQQLKQEHQQLKQEHQQLKQEHQQLKQEHQQLKQEHQQLKQEHQQLKQEHQQLRQRFEVRIRDWLRRTLRKYR
ncbi:MAG: methyltransferase domain-containing protein [Gammaproteobacteria bacterium]|nr:methyltransferase domain-containing protein [Gammaproteobacteria bacterium]